MFRILLQIKKIPYEIVWMNYEDIERVAKEVGAEPTTKKLDGTPFYTVPFITVTTDANQRPLAISDSTRIAYYLEKLVPEPVMIPKGTDAFHAAFSQCCTNLLITMFPLAIESYADALVSRDHFWNSRVDLIGKRSEDIVAKGDAVDQTWKASEQELDKIAGYLDANVREGASPGEAENQQTLVMGDRQSYADIHLVSMLLTAARFVPGGWERIKGRNGGRWERLMKVYAEYLPPYA